MQKRRRRVIETLTSRGKRSSGVQLGLRVEPKAYYPALQKYLISEDGGAPLKSTRMDWTRRVAKERLQGEASGASERRCKYCVSVLSRMNYQALALVLLRLKCRQYRIMLTIRH
jgi:hypothetical protein